MVSCLSYFLTSSNDIGTTSNKSIQFRDRVVNASSQRRRNSLSQVETRVTVERTGNALRTSWRTLGPLYTIVRRSDIAPSR